MPINGSLHLFVVVVVVFACWYFKHGAKDSDLIPLHHFPFRDITFPTQDMTCPQPLSRNHEQSSLVETERHPAMDHQKPGLSCCQGLWKADIWKGRHFYPLPPAELLSGKPEGFLYLALSPGPTHGSGCLAQCLIQKICKNLLDLETFRKGMNETLSHGILARILKSCELCHWYLISFLNQRLLRHFRKSLLKLASKRPRDQWM